ncbi:MAG: choice-of-anchor I family protein [Anaerocolumna sp.]
MIKKSLKNFTFPVLFKSIVSFLFVLVFLQGAAITSVSAAEKSSGYYQDVPGKIDMNTIGRYDVDKNDPEGGLEIVAYDKQNQFAYAVDGMNRVLIAVNMKSLKTDEITDLNSQVYQINLAADVEARVNDFTYGDLTSVAVSPDNTRLAVAIQAKNYDEQGVLAIFPIDDSDDTLGEPVYFRTGIQPDMVVFANNNTALTADEGEPRMGYGINSAGVEVVDPKGSVSIIDLVNKTVTIADFDSFDAKRDVLAASGVLMTKGQAPSVDFEPEYIAVNSDGSKAYVTLQENNAIAVLDINSGIISNVFALGFKDFSMAGNEIYLDGSAKTYDNLVGAYMPDGISIYENGGKTYILTANEGDGREWSSSVYPKDHEDAGDPNKEDTSYFSDEKKITVTDRDGNEIKKVVTIDSTTTDGLPEGKNVIFGGRSFSMFEITNKGPVKVFDSGSDFEDITLKVYPGWFNASHDNVDLNDRSIKKGPEPENLTIGKVGNHTYVFVVLERIGGIMAYDITDSTSISFSNYINTRDFAAKNGIGGDSGPEGICFVPATGSPTGKALLLSGCKITGTMPVYEVTDPLDTVSGKLVILHTNDTHGGDVAIDGVSIGTAGVKQLVNDYEAAGAEVLLLSAGDAIQGDPLVNLSGGKNAIEFMNLAGYDMMVPGNHEFDYGYDNLTGLEKIADFPFISSNILNKKSGEDEFKENIIFDTKVGKVGVFGLTTPETRTKANPDNVASLNFLAGDAMYKKAQQQVDELSEAGCDYIICVAHLGIDDSSKPNRSIDVIDHVKGINILIDGHSHSVIDGNEADKTILASAGTKLSNVGVIIIGNDIEESKLISASEYNGVDKAVNDEIMKESEKIDDLLSETFATTEVVLDGNVTPGVRTMETNLGDFAADAILWAANQAVGEGKVVAAITNGGGIRASINIGDVTMKDMKTVFPFGNTISTVSVTGAQLLEILEAATFSTPGALGGFPQVSGIEFTINTTIPYANGTMYSDSTYYAPAKPGVRITDVKVGGKALELDKTYTIATNDFLAAGGDTYYAFKKSENFNTYVPLEDALVNYTKEVLDGVITKELYGKAAGRINIVDTPATQGIAETSDKNDTNKQNAVIKYTVKSGDCLWVIAKKYLGYGARYEEIYELNKDRIKDPNNIYIGQVLEIPAA